MLNDYDDILALTDRKPLWYDEHGTPRFCGFTPMQCANIYAHEAALVLIACQNCRREYRVAFTMDDYSFVRGDLVDTRGRLAARIRDGSLHFGDPPCFECSAGATMNCDDLRVIEYWKRVSHTWERDHSLEIALDGMYGNPDSPSRAAEER